MEQKNIWKNITGTAFFLGLALSSMNTNGTMLVDDMSGSLAGEYGSVENVSFNSTNNYLYYENSNVYVQKRSNQLEKEATALFGKMREATREESIGINDYIRTISKDTGVNFYDLC